MKITFEGVVGPSSTDELSIFENDFIGQSVKLTFSADSLGSPAFYEFIYPVWYYDICGYGCHQFGGYDLHYGSGNPWSIGQEQIVSLLYTNLDMATSIEVGGRLVQFDIDSESYHYSNIEMYNDYPKLPLNYEYVRDRDSLWVEADYYSEDWNYGAIVNTSNQGADAFSSVDLISPAQYGLGFSDSSYGRIYWQLFDGNDWMKTNLYFTPHTLTIGEYVEPSAVPEPSTWAMMLLGFAGVGAALRRSRRRSLLPA